MAHILKALVGEGSGSIGTGDIALASALTGQRRFNEVLSVGDTTEAMVRHVSNGSWEHGTYTYSAANTLTRLSIEESSNGNAAVNFASGGLTVILTPLSSRLSSGGGGGGGATNLSYTASPTNGLVASDTGTDATLPLVDGTNAGLMAPAQHTKLAGIAAGAQVNPANTDALSEGSTNLYSTAARIRGTVLTGLSTAVGTVVAATHTVLEAIGFLQKQVSDNTTAISGKAATGAIGSSGLTMATAKLLGRSTASTGAVEEITLGTNLSFSGTTLNAAGGSSVSQPDLNITRSIQFGAF